MDGSGWKLARIALAAVLGLAAGVATGIAILIVGVGVFWLFLFGDDPWPSAAERALVAVAYGAGILVFLAAVWSQARTRS